MIAIIPFEALEYRSVKDALLPSHFVYREGEKLVIDATVHWTLLDARPDEAFVAPEDWRHAFYCKSFAMPVPKSAPQPAAKGGIDAPVITVEVRVHVRPDGTVGKAEVLKPVRDDLDSEAVELVKTWTYEPGVCEGDKARLRHRRRSALPRQVARLQTGSGITFSWHEPSAPMKRFQEIVRHLSTPTD